LVNQLATLQIAAVSMPVDVDGKRLYRVGSKPYPTRRAAETDAKRAAKSIRGMDAEVIRRTGNVAKLAAEFGWVP
jgi:hypothetical protein